MRSNDTFAWTAHVNVDRPYAANGLNQYSTAGPAAFGYDSNGNLTSDGFTTFLYDIENRLVSASGAKTAALRYDPMGRLYEVSGSSGTTRFLYDGDALVGEYNASGILLRRYVHGADAKADDPIAWYEGASLTETAERRLRPDWLGSIVLVTDSTGASVLAVNRYDEYGIPQSSNSGRFQYTGQAWIAELGMYYYKARIYSPTLGRFLQTDPIGYEDQINLYVYVGNDPVNKVDPTGKSIYAREKDRPILLKLINQISRTQYKFDKNGNLQIDTKAGINKNGSSYYSSRLNTAINGRQTITIFIAEKLYYHSPLPNGRESPLLSVVSVRESGEGVTSPSGRSVAISGRSNVDPRDGVRSTAGQILAHELVGHAIPMIFGGGSGNAITNENTVRGQTGAPLRVADPTHTEEM